MENNLAEIAAMVAAMVAERIERHFNVMPTLTLDQAAEAMGLSMQKVRQLCLDGKIPYLRVDKFYRIKPGDINNYLDKNYMKEGRHV